MGNPRLLPVLILLALGCADRGSTRGALPPAEEARAPAPAPEARIETTDFEAGGKVAANRHPRRPIRLTDLLAMRLRPEDVADSALPVRLPESRRDLAPPWPFCPWDLDSRYNEPEYYYCLLSHEYARRFPGMYVCELRFRAASASGERGNGGIFVGATIEEAVAKVLTYDPSCIFTLVIVPPAQVYAVEIYVARNDRTIRIATHLKGE